MPGHVVMISRTALLDICSIYTMVYLDTTGRHRNGIDGEMGGTIRPRPWKTIERLILKSADTAETAPYLLTRWFLSRLKLLSLSIGQVLTMITIDYGR